MQAELSNNIIWELSLLNFLTRIYNFIKKLTGLIGLALIFIISIPLILFLVLILNINNKKRLSKWINDFEALSPEQKIDFYNQCVEFNHSFHKHIKKSFPFKRILINVLNLQQYIEKEYLTDIPKKSELEQNLSDEWSEDEMNIYDSFFVNKNIKDNSNFIASHSIFDDWNNAENNHWDSY